MSEKLPTRSKGRTVDQVTDKIKRMLFFDFMPGQKLPYHDLAKSLNTSVTPIVQALKSLEEARLVCRKPNRGYYVGEMTEKEVRELYEAREALEIYVVPSVIQNLDTKGVESIKRAFRDYTNATPPENRRVLMFKDASFHLKIVEYAGNKVIYELLSDIFERIYLRYKPEYLSEETVRNATKKHREILEAFRRKNSKEACSLLKEHIIAGMGNVIENIRMKQETAF